MFQIEIMCGVLFNLQISLKNQGVTVLFTRGTGYTVVMTSAFDSVAASFDRYRTVPDQALVAIRKTIWDSTGMPESSRVLDMGAGTGRFGHAFVAAGDLYVGVDISLPMLREFQARNANACL